MRRALPVGWSISVVSAALALAMAVLAYDVTPWAAAGVLVVPALLLGWSDSRPHVAGSYLLAVTLTALVALTGAFSHHSPIAGVPLAVFVAPAVGGLAALWSQLVLGGRARRWSFAMGASMAVVMGSMLLGLAAAERAGALREPPQLLAIVPPCTASCSPHFTPSGHKRCATVTKNDRIEAVRECDASSFVHVRADGRETSVLVSQTESLMVWQVSSGELIVTEEGTPTRGLSANGSIMLAPSLGWSPSVPLHASYAIGGSLLLVGVSLAFVLRSLQKQRSLAAGLIGHVEAGRFFPRDNHLMPMPVAGVYTNGPAVLFGAARRLTYRDGGGSPVRILSGTLRELTTAHHARRFWAFALALGAVLFAMVSVSADLARLQ